MTSNDLLKLSFVEIEFQDPSDPPIQHGIDIVNFPDVIYLIQRPGATVS